MEKSKRPKIQVDVKKKSKHSFSLGERAGATIESYAKFLSDFEKALETWPHRSESNAIHSEAGKVFGHDCGKNGHVRTNEPNVRQLETRCLTGRSEEAHRHKLCMICDCFRSHPVVLGKVVDNIDAPVETNDRLVDVIRKHVDGFQSFQGGKSA